MRVAYVAVHAWARDGWGRYAVELARAAGAQGVEPVLVTAHGEADPLLRGAECHAVLPDPSARPFGIPRSLLAARRVRPILRSCELVHCVVEPLAPLVAVGAPAGMPYVQTAHGTWAVRPLRRRLDRIFYLLALKRIDLLVFQSRFTRDRMAELAPLPRHTILRGAVNRDEFEGPGDIELPQWPARGRVVLSVGALKHRKGHHVALEAVAQASAHLPDLQFVLVGDGVGTAYAARLRDLAQRRGLADRFHLLGSISQRDLVACYRRADVFMLLPIEHLGSFEGLGLVYLEAGAAGRACVGTRGTGAEEALNDGVTGFLVPQNDPQAAAAALVRLLQDDLLRAKMGEAARRRAGQFSWSQLAEALRKEYDALLQGRRKEAA